MTDLTLAAGKFGFLAQLICRLRDWLNEPVHVEAEIEAPVHFSRSDWADLPVHHPIRDDRGGR